MPPPAPWSLTAREDEVRLDLAPTGFVAYYRTTLAAVIMLGTILVPLGLVGLIGGLAWHDFPLALRLVMGVFGGAAVAGPVWLSLWLVLAATSLRSRVRVRAGGVLVERGHVRPSTSLWLARHDLAIVRSGATEFSPPGVVISQGGRTIKIGVGLDGLESAGLLAALHDALRTIPAGPAEGPPPPERLGPTWSARARGLLDDLLRPLRRPTSFLLLDVGAIVGLFLLQWVLTDLVDRRLAYRVAFVVFLLGLAARRFDGSYIAGLRRLRADNPTWSLYYVLGGLALGLACMFGAGSMRLPGLVLLALLLLPIALHVWLLRLARGADPPPPRNRVLDLALAATLIPISVLHESVLFEFFAGARHLGPLALAMLVPAVAVAYLPVRMHAFVDEPDDRANVVWFWLTVGLLTLQPLLTIGPAFTR